MARLLLVVGQELQTQRSALVKFLDTQGYDITLVSSYIEAVQKLETEKFERLITSLFPPESPEENVGETGEKLIRFLKEIDVGSELQQPFSCGSAPLGLRIWAAAFAKGTPALIIYEGNRYAGDGAFVRYALAERTGIFLERITAFIDGKEDWINVIASSLEKLREDAKEILFVDLETREEIFGV